MTRQKVHLTLTDMQRHVLQVKTLCQVLAQGKLKQLNYKPTNKEVRLETLTYPQLQQYQKERFKMEQTAGNSHMHLGLGPKQLELGILLFHTVVTFVVSNYLLAAFV